MKTALFIPTYLDGVDYFGSSRLLRQIRCLKWYDGLRDELGFEHILLSDNGSSLVSRTRLLESEVKYEVISNTPHLVGGGHVRYPYCWRHLYNMWHLIDAGYDKIIAVDSDAFIVSKRLSQYILSLKSGWTSFNERRHRFPTAELHVLCKDSFWIYEQFCSVPYMSHMGKLMETSIPFTHIEHGFYCERSGELKKPQDIEQDLYGQASLEIPLAYK